MLLCGGASVAVPRLMSYGKHLLAKGRKILESADPTDIFITANQESDCNLKTIKQGILLASLERQL